MKKTLSLMALAALSMVGFGQSRPARDVAGGSTDAVEGALPPDSCPPNCIIVIGIRG